MDVDENNDIRKSGDAASGAAGACDWAPAPNAETRPSAGWPAASTALLAALVLGVFAVLFTEPVQDGDPWWQMAYGRELLRNRTLVPDHTVFTWTPAERDTIYCSWISQIFLYLAHCVGGLPLLFAFRYACMLLLPLAFWRQARAAGLAGRPLAWLLCLLGVLMSYGAAHLKPEIFSYACFVLTAATWMRVKRADVRAARACYLLPLIMVVWVNSHGGFIFGLFFLILMFVGEEMNALYCERAALPLQVRKHLFLAVALSGLAVLATPYGWAYPMQLVRALASPVSAAMMSQIQAYRSIFTAGAERLHLLEYLCCAALLMAVLIAMRLRSGEVDWALVLTNVGLAIIYARFIRAAFYWPPVLVFSALRLLSQLGTASVRRRLLAARTVEGLAVAALLFLAGRTVWERVTSPPKARWSGVGISYYNPVEEAEYIRQRLAGCRLGNDYVSGGYLLWKLWPDTKVLIDPRQFPFRKWYATYRDFEIGRDVNALLKRFPADAWCMSHHYEKPLSRFVGSARWAPVFYGPAAAVFVRTDGPCRDAPRGRGAGIADIRNLTQARYVLEFALIIGDVEGARLILDGMRKRFRLPGQRRITEPFVDLVDGVQAYCDAEYGKAAGLLAAALDSGQLKSPALPVKCWQHLTGRHWATKDDQAARQAAQAALALDPQNLISLHNAGVIEWRLSGQAETPPTGADKVEAGAAAATAWRPHLEQFVAKVKGRNVVPKRTLVIAEAMLAGRCRGRPAVLIPPKPTLWDVGE